jgi:hypothetical protein
MLLQLIVSLKRLIARAAMTTLLAIVSVLPVCHAQTVSGAIIGEVRDRAGQPVPEAKVLVINVLNRNRRGTRSNEKGSYIIPNLPPGSYHIIASKEDYQDQCISSFQVLFNKNNTVKYPPIFTLPKHSGSSENLTCQALISGQSSNITQTDRHTQEVAEYRKVSKRDFSLSPITYLPTVSIFKKLPEPFKAQSIPLAWEPIGLPYVGFQNAVNSIITQTPPQKPSDGQTTASNSQNTASTQVSQGVEIAGLANTTDAARSSNFTESQILSLPLGGTSYMRIFDDLALLVAGVAPPPYTPGVRGPSIGFGIGTAGQFSVNGMRARANNFSVDGSDNNDPDVGVRRGGYVAQVPQSIESVQEVSISTLLWSAELGRNFGSQVNAVSKYGGNDYHGQLYGFFTDSRLNARNFFDYSGGPSGAENPLTRSQAGFVIGGPLSRERAQFFGGFEVSKINTSDEQHFSSPKCSDRRLPDGPAPVCDGRLSPDGSLTIDYRPQSFLDSESFLILPGRGGASPLGNDILSYYPVPNNSGGPYGDNTYTEVLPADGRGIIVPLKASYQITENNTINARFNFTDDKSILPSVNRATRSTIGANTRSYNLSLIFDSQINPKLFNQARFSLGRTQVIFPEHPLGPFTLPDRSSPADIYAIDPFFNTLGRFGRLNTSVKQLGELVVDPFSPVGVNSLLFPQGRTNNTFQFADTMSWHWHNHFLKFGADIRRIQLNSFQDRLYRPQVNFSYGLAALLDLEMLRGGFTYAFFSKLRSQKYAVLSGVQLATLPMPGSILQTLTADAPNSRIGLRITEYSFFLNDNLRVRPNLTFDYGLRYEFNTVPREVNNRIENALTLRNVPVTGPSRYMGLIAAYSKVLNGRTRIYDSDRNNFGPHFGFAWDPSSTGKLSVRAGYGLYFDAVLGAVVNQSRNIFPNELPVGFGSEQIGNRVIPIPAQCKIVVCIGGTTPTNQFKGGSGAFVDNLSTLLFNPGLLDVNDLFGGYRLNAGIYGIAFTLPEKNLRSSYSQQWHLTLEREALNNSLVSVAYVGTKGTKLIRLMTPNLGITNTPGINIGIVRQIIDSTTPPAKSLPIPQFLSGSVVVNYPGAYGSTNPNLPRLSSRPLSSLGPYQIFESSAASNYHALQIEATRRYGPSFNFTLAYTWSHAIDDVSDLFPISGSPVLAQSQKNLEADRGNAGFDIRHRFVTSINWDLPFSRKSKNKVARRLGDWQLAAIFQAQTGQPFTLNLPVDANLDGNLTDRPSTTEGFVFLDGHQPQKVTLAPGFKLEDFFTFGRDGVVGRNTVRGDSFINLDLSLTRTFRFTEQKKLAFRVDFFNLFNRANFGLPVRTLDAPAFGSAVDTVNPARVIQLALKFNF